MYRFHWFASVCGNEERTDDVAIYTLYTSIRFTRTEMAFCYSRSRISIQTHKAHSHTHTHTHGSHSVQRTHKRNSPSLSHSMNTTAHSQPHRKVFASRIYEGTESVLVTNRERRKFKSHRKAEISNATQFLFNLKIFSSIHLVAKCVLSHGIDGF